ncbi:MAG: hypothetical protein NVS2B17_18350 [Candidatus Velthaea sp.]
MQMTVQSRPNRMPGIEMQSTGSEFLVHDTRNAKVHVLNATAGRIFTLCDGEHDVEEIVDSLVSEWGAERTTARADVGRALRDFAERALLAPPG